MVPVSTIEELSLLISVCKYENLSSYALRRVFSSQLMQLDERSTSHLEENKVYLFFFHNPPLSNVIAVVGNKLQW